MKRMLVGCGMCLVFAPLPAAAQPPLDSVKAGQQIRVTDAVGDRFSGRVEVLTSDTVTVSGRVFRTAQVTKIERKGDSLWNGVAIGAAVGLLLPLLPSEACFKQSRAGCIASGIETGALLGVAVDAVHRGYTTVYQANRRTTLRVVPRMERHAANVAFAVSF
jgi:hypothetical protein